MVIHIIFYHRHLVKSPNDAHVSISDLKRAPWPAAYSTVPQAPSHHHWSECMAFELSLMVIRSENHVVTISGCLSTTHHTAASQSGAWTTTQGRRCHVAVWCHQCVYHERCSWSWREAFEPSASNGLAWMWNHVTVEKLTFLDIPLVLCGCIHHQVCHQY